VVTGTNMFGRSLGSALGVAVFGAVANATLADRFAAAPARLGDSLPSSADDAAYVLDPASDAGPAVQAFVQSALSDATHLVFVGMVISGVLLVGAVLLLPRRTAALVFDD
jgi:hypothetical protein